MWHMTSRKSATLRNLQISFNLELGAMKKIKMLMIRVNKQITKKTQRKKMKNNLFLSLSNQKWRSQTTKDQCLLLQTLHPEARSQSVGLSS